jgi:protein SCO1/2
MKSERAVILSVAFVIGAGLPAPARAQQQERKPGSSVVDDVGFDQKLDIRLPLDLRLRTDSGRDIALGDLFGARPVILAPVYYRCPLLCNQLLNGLTRGLKPLSLDPGKDYDIVAFSIDPTEAPELAGQKKANYVERFDRPGTESGWHFLTGDASSIETLTRTIGFRYTYNPQTKLFAHAAGIVIATPDGRTARYFFGIDLPPRELQYELERASQGRIGSPIGRLLLLCYDYDAATGKYTLSIVRLTRVLGMATALALGTYLIIMFRRDRRGARASRPTTPRGEDGPERDGEDSWDDSGWDHRM